VVATPRLRSQESTQWPISAVPTWHIARPTRHRWRRLLSEAIAP
jgi:hypothetical protein